ncbi:MAG: hypothetical protein QW594_00130 [Candidatus Woesearchaeota archaeon]
MTTTGPIFVKVTEYKEINEAVSQLKTYISQAKDLIAQIEKMKKEEEMYLQKWKLSISELQKRTENIETMLYKVQ